MSVHSDRYWQTPEDGNVGPRLVAMVMENGVSVGGWLACSMESPWQLLELSTPNRKSLSGEFGGGGGSGRVGLG